MRHFSNISGGNFVQLYRTFKELPSDAGGNDDLNSFEAGFFLNFSGVNSITWEDILEKKRVVLLSEAGSGKTVELQNMAAKLITEGRYAFFLRLEDVTENFELAFEEGSFEIFTQWKNSCEPAWIFLDSVDEVKLKEYKEFNRAIKVLSAEISDAVERIYLIISSRSSAWNPVTDLRLCSNSFPMKGIPKSTSTSCTENKVISSNDAKSTRANFELYTFHPLTPEQVSKLAKSYNVDSLENFLDALSTRNTSDLHMRPIDIESLVYIWNKNRKLGSPLELMQANIEYKLKEHNKERDRHNHITSEDCRQGVQLLAAALTLSKKNQIQIQYSSKHNIGLTVEEVLENWETTKYESLLQRAVFVADIHGTVRFYHRSVREYMTAEWLSKLLEKNTSRRNIENLLFQKKYGITVVIPTMRPVLPWLVLLDNKICKKLITIAPEVFLEGGDPLRLPHSMRLEILDFICQRMEQHELKGRFFSHDNIQRFVCDDLGHNIQSWLNKKNLNTDQVYFLLLLVWIGKIPGVLHEVKRYALNSNIDKYSRIIAFRAVGEVGHPEDMQEIREYFLNADTVLPRKCIEELCVTLPSSKDSIDWLLLYLQKFPHNPKKYGDDIFEGIKGFIKKCDLEILPYFVIRIDELLQVSPYTKKSHFGIRLSEKFLWLLPLAARCVIRLIEAKSDFAINEISLNIIYNVANCYGEFGGEYPSTSQKVLATIVPQWDMLNKAYFWYTVQRKRQDSEAKKQKITHFHQLYATEIFFNFDDSLQYLLGELVSRKNKDDKSLLLSMAVRIFENNEKSAEIMSDIQAAIIHEPHLQTELDRYLTPIQHKVYEWQRKQEQREIEQDKNREGWRAGLQKNCDKLRNSTLPLGVMSNFQSYLYDEMFTNTPSMQHWSNGNWKSLTEYYGEEVASAFRDGAIAFWRNYVPQLVSEGFSGTNMPPEIAFGLCGLQMESEQNTSGQLLLSEAEAVLATRYALHEMNGFPSWFQEVFTTHVSAVAKVLKEECLWRMLNAAENESTGIIHTFFYHAKWAWDKFVPLLIALLQNVNPCNIQDLENVIKILNQSSLSDVDLAILVKTKVNSGITIEHKSYWLAMWFGITPHEAWDSFLVHIEVLPNQEDKTKFIQDVIGKIVYENRGESLFIRDAFLQQPFLSQLTLLAYEHIRVEDDINRAGRGVYTPEKRDQLQDARGWLFNQLCACSGKEAFLTILSLVNIVPIDSYKSWFMQKAHTKAATDADLNVWNSRDILKFQNSLAKTPKSHAELAELVNMLFLDIKDELEQGDSSIANLLKRASEVEVRNYLGEELRKKASGRYSIPQEEELADKKRPDLRFHGCGFDAPVPVEVKIAENWSGPELYERLENQLCGDYLRDTRSSYGVYVLVYQGNGKRQSWKMPDKTIVRDLGKLIKGLRGCWEKTLSMKFQKIDDIYIIGIDITKRYV